jgi:hypothetical protein
LGFFKRSIKKPKAGKEIKQSESELREIASNLIQEYKKFGFYWFVLSKEEEEKAVKKILGTLSDYNKWPEDWQLIAGDERNIYWFDTEWDGDLEHMYIEFLNNLNKLNRDDLKFENIKDYVDLDQNSKAWVEFDWMGQRYHFDLECNGDWIDYPNLLTYINDLLSKAGKSHRFVVPFNTGDQTCLLSYLSLNEINGLIKDKRWSVMTDDYLKV